MARFAGRVVLVTGAASGIGRATVEEFAREGARVVATDLNGEALEENCTQLTAEGLSVEAQVQDVSDRDIWTAVVDGIVERHGRMDVLVNNAGDGHFASIEDTTPEQWRFVNAVNLDGVFFGTQAGIAAMKQKGGRHRQRGLHRRQHCRTHARCLQRDQGRCAHDHQDGRGGLCPQGLYQGSMIVTRLTGFTGFPARRVASAAMRGIVISAQRCPEGR